MKNDHYNFQFERLCNTLQLGTMIGAPKSLSGGLLHRMHCVETTQGKYAIKALNPKIMSRPKAMQRYIASGRIAEIAVSNIPALPAKRFYGKFMHEIDNQFYLVFDWLEGKSLKPGEINTAHCERMGSILADIHTMDFSELGMCHGHADSKALTDWKYYLQKGKENNAPWVNLLNNNITELYDWNTQANAAQKHLTSDLVISHRDLDPKNVLWVQDNPIIIDWESAGYANQMLELTETAFYWSENEKGNISKERFLAFINGYKKRCGTLKADWRIVLSGGFSGKLGWLEYNLKRSLMLECAGEEEKQLGTAQVVETISAIKYYADMLSEIIGWLKDI